MQFDKSGWLFPRTRLDKASVHAISEDDVLSLFDLQKEERLWQKEVQESADTYNPNGPFCMDFFQSYVS